MNERGRPIRGVVSAISEVDLYNQLQTAGLELIDCSVIGADKSAALGGMFAKKVKMRDLIQLFIHLEQMQSAGVPMLDSLADIRDTTENDRMRDILSDVHRDVSDGSSLSEAVKRHPKVFHNLYVSLIKAGEDTGDLTSVYIQLISYLKWVDAMQSKIKKATRYPTILLVVVLLVVVVMMGFVVPQIVGFLNNMDQELNIFTTSLIATSNFFKDPLFTIFGFSVPGGAVVLLVPVLLFMIVKFLRNSSDELAYRIDALILRAPIAGSLIRKITIARYAQTFGALFTSGIDVIGALRASRETVTNIAMLEALESVERYVQSGSALSEAFNACGEFPSLVVRMVKIGEESGNLGPVLDQVSEFYTKDVDEAVDGLITMIEPALTGVLGIMILWIAVAVFGPIYGMLGELDI